jgi:hypothetical protein
MQTLSKSITSSTSSTVATSTKIVFTVTTTTGADSVVTVYANETDTIYAYLSNVFNELDGFVKHVTNFLTDVFQQTRTPLGSQVNQVTVTTAANSNFLAKSSGGTQLSVNVIVDSNYANPKTTPFSMPSLGKHTFAAPSTWTNSTPRVPVVFNFVQWQDDTNAVVSTSPTFTYNLISSKTFTAIYARPSYTLVVIVYDNTTTLPVRGALVSLNGTAEGSTGSNGKLAISGVTAGNYQLVITKTGYNEYGPTTITITGNRAIIVYLQTSPP